MKAIAVFPATKEVKLIDHPEPKITQPTQVKIKIRNVGVCGTDREIWNLEYGTPPAGSDYLITGHESVGEVVEVGSAVADFKVGDTVVPTVRRGCPENCISCANGQPDFCFTGHFTERGIKGVHGYMAEYVVDDAKYMNKIPPEIGDHAVLLEPLTITEKALIQIYTIQSRLHWECQINKGVTDKSCRNAVVLGAGPVGCLAAMAFKNMNMKVTVVSRGRKPNAGAALVESVGVEYLSTQDVTPAQVAEKIGNIDVVLEATGAAQVSYDYMQVLGTNGIFIFTGVPGSKKDITLDAGTLMRSMVLRNQVVLGTVNAPKAAFENGARDLRDFRRKWPTALDHLITARVPIDRFKDALARHTHDAIKTILTFGNN
jgi:threonine dehydrogenase-like Zn-dependent dehydrogenase